MKRTTVIPMSLGGLSVLCLAAWAQSPQRDNSTVPAEHVAVRPDVGGYTSYDLTQEELEMPFWWRNFPHGDLWENYCQQKRPEHNPHRQWHPLMRLAGCGHGCGQWQIFNELTGCGSKSCGSAGCQCQAKTMPAMAAPAVDVEPEPPVVAPQPPVPPVDVFTEPQEFPAPPEVQTVPEHPVTPQPSVEPRIPRNQIPSHVRSDESVPMSQLPVLARPVSTRIGDYISVD